ncbi:hypothetical protein K439DRAFT_1349123 [Ramaria rubella]|nr:hypothetical protein K439DRAFT_1349123 [Ramaria rubella]
MDCSPSTSCGIISMVCLNLPLSICYKPENMYIAGIINGPREPQLLAINHHMRPLVDDLALSWQRSVWFSKTAMCPSGHMTRSAVATTVCDLPGACKAAQLASHGSHNYCSVCQCIHLSTQCRTDFETWKRHDTQEMCCIVVQWRDAPTNKDQEMLFKEHGICWSELWHLPYWDPTRQLVVDSMHCILERVVQGHVHNALELSTKAAKVRLTLEPAFVHTFSKLGSHDTTEIDMTPKEIKQVKKLQALLLDPIYGSNRETQEQGLNMLDVLNNTVTPLWLNSMPHNFGESAAGMLKADEWCTLSTVYLPLTLISLWGAGTTHQDSKTARRLRATLDHTMTLFSAVHLVCMRTMTKACMSSYHSYMATYIKDLKEIHPTINHTTSHHMALHIYNFLGPFSPVHSWWCFPFERLIGILQQQPSNHKFGKNMASLNQSC